MRPATAETRPRARSPRRRAGNGADGEEQRDHVEPDEAALLLFVVDDVERVEDRLHAGIGAPQRDAEPQEKAEGELAVALGRDARDLVAQQIERAGGDDIGGNRKMLADRRRHWRTARRTTRRRRWPETRRPANRTQRPRPAPTGGRPGFRDRCGRRRPSSRARESATARARRGRGRVRRRAAAARSAAPAPASRAAEEPEACGLAAAIVLKLEAIDDACRDHHGRGRTRKSDCPDDDYGRGDGRCGDSCGYRKGNGQGGPVVNDLLAASGFMHIWANWPLANWPVDAAAGCPSLPGD